MKKREIFNICFAGLSIAVAYILPFLTGQIPEIGSMISPMHIPVFICGMICGYKYGMIVGFVSPLLRSLTLTMPPLYPTAICMSFELATYGFISGLLFNHLIKKTSKLVTSIYLSLIISMIIGKIVFGLSHFTIGLFDSQNAYTFKLFILSTIVNVWPGIIIHIIIVPAVILTMYKTKLLKDVI